VPTPDGSIAVLNAVIKKDVTVEQVNKAFADAAKGKLKGILQYADEPIVSRDIIQNPHSCIFDSLLTAVTDKRLVSISGWYDNEWGFSCRMVDAIKLMMK
jgi:glyceraldehyde 3-phosphate dehydrogenase